MKPLTYFDKIGQQVASHPVQVIKLEMRANAALAAGCFWQVHDTDVAPSNGDEPLKAWPAYAGAADYKEFKRGELNLTRGLYLVMSTTEATLTAGTGSNKFAMVAAELTEAERPSGTSTAGDLTTPVYELAVWADAAGPKRLTRVQVEESTLTADRYIMLFAHDAPADGETPLATWKIENGGDPLDLRFGADGRDVFSLSGSTRRDGCKLVLSDTPDTLTKAENSSFDQVVIKAEYK